MVAKTLQSNPKSRPKKKGSLAMDGQISWKKNVFET